MTPAESLMMRVARLEPVTVTGRWWRHSSTSVPANQLLQGSPSGGRWGVRDGKPVLYLGRPRDSVTVEAFRHLVDGVEGMNANAVKPRRWLQIDVQLHQVLDLREVGQAPVVTAGAHRERWTRSPQPPAGKH